MKLLDSLVERSLLTSKKFIVVVKSVHALAKQLAALSRNVGLLAARIQHHERLLGEIYHANKVMFQDMKEDSVDLSLPETRKTEEKPN